MTAKRQSTESRPTCVDSVKSLLVRPLAVFVGGGTPAGLLPVICVPFVAELFVLSRIRPERWLSALTFGCASFIFFEIAKWMALRFAAR